ncbi:MAG TPA: hypothetical protein DD621_01710 [Clostridiales bacterium]|nr:hypothetical protein [Clostridiales bacterium]
MIRVNTNTLDYIKQLENEIELLKHRLIEEIRSSNRLIMGEKIKNEQLAKENAFLRQRNSYLILLTK